jgi:hypothetical protein
LQFFLNIFQKNVLFSKLTKGCVMQMMIKNVESLFEKFENTIEKWANKVF